MKKISYGIIDAVKSLFIGIIAGTIFEIIFFLIGLIVYTGHLVDALIVSRNVMILIGALGLLISSGLFFKKDSLRPLKDKEGWKRNFKVINFAYMLLILFVGILLAGGILDSVIYELKK